MALQDIRVNRNGSSRSMATTRSSYVFDQPGPIFIWAFPWDGVTRRTADGLGDGSTKFQGEFLLRDKLRCDEVDVDDGHVATDIAKVFRYDADSNCVQHSNVKM